MNPETLVRSIESLQPPLRRPIPKLISMRVARTRLTLGLLGGIFSAAAVAAPAAPTELQAMRLLYGNGYTQRGSVVSIPDPLGIRANKEPGYHNTITEYVTPWKIAIVNLNGKTYFTATGQGHAVTEPSNPESAAHVQSAYISAIWFVLEGNRWVPAGKRLNFAVGGSSGVVDGKPWTDFPQMAPLKDSILLVAEEGGDMHQGYGSSWYPVYVFDKTGLNSLGEVTSGGDNTGAEASPVISFSGKIVAATTAANGQPLITLSYSGETVIQGKPVKMNGVLCGFLYRKDVKQPDTASFMPQTPQCTDIASSASF